MTQGKLVYCASNVPAVGGWGRKSKIGRYKPLVAKANVDCIIIYFSGTNDKAGGPSYMLKFASAQSIKQTFVPLTDIEYPYMK